MYDIGSTYYVKMTDGIEARFILHAYSQTVHGEPIYFMSTDGTMYNWRNITIMRRF